MIAIIGSLTWTGTSMIRSAPGLVFVSGPAVTPGITLERAIGLLLEAKRQSGCRAGYLGSLRQYLAQFARGREQAPLSSIGVEQVENWFSGRTEASSSRRSNCGRLGSLFAFAVRRGWLQDNPIKRLERIRHDEHAPRVLTVKEAEQLLTVTRRKKPVALAYLVLAMLAGIRPEELRGVGWADVDLKKGQVRIDGTVSKVRRRRLVPLHANAVRWLKLAKRLKSTLPCSQMTRKRYVLHFRRVLGMKRWSQDILRHTAASYWLAEEQDAGKVARWLGNSAGILLRYYVELVDKETAEEFWRIAP